MSSSGPGLGDISFVRYDNESHLRQGYFKISLVTPYETYQTSPIRKGKKSITLEDVILLWLVQITVMHNADKNGFIGESMINKCTKANRCYEIQIIYCSIHLSTTMFLISCLRTSGCTSCLWPILLYC